MLYSGNGSSRKGKLMTLRRSLWPAIAFTIAAIPAYAQMGAPGGGKPPCWDDFMPLREEAQKRATAISVAGKRKAPPNEVCQLFNRFAEAETKVIKFVEENGTWCGIPPDALKQMKESQAKGDAMRKNVCAVAAAPRPQVPTLGDALGTTRVPDVSKARTGTGTFDTLTGSPPAR
jgi:hypothetical protein